MKIFNINFVFMIMALGCFNEIAAQQISLDDLNDLASNLGIKKNANWPTIEKKTRQFVYLARINPQEDAVTDVGSKSCLETAQLAKAHGIRGSCGLFSTIETKLLNCLGVPARTVQLASERFVLGNDLYDTHVVVEYSPDGYQWRVSDPTFNVTASCESNLSSVYDLRNCLLNNREILTSSEDGVVVEPYSVQSYYRPYRVFFYEYTRRALNMVDNTGLRWSLESEESTLGWLDLALSRYEKELMNTEVGLED